MSLSASVLRVALVARAAALSVQIVLEDCKLPKGSTIHEPNTGEGFKEAEGLPGVKSFYEYETKLYGPENAVVQNTQDICVPEACYWSPVVEGQLIMISDGSAEFATDFKCRDGSEFFATRHLSVEEAQNVKEITITSTSGNPLWKGEVPVDVPGDFPWDVEGGPNSEVPLLKEKEPCELTAGAKVSNVGGSAVGVKGAGVMHPSDKQCVPEECYNSGPGMTESATESSTTYWQCENEMEFRIRNYWGESEVDLEELPKKGDICQLDADAEVSFGGEVFRVRGDGVVHSQHGFAFPGLAEDLCVPEDCLMSDNEVPTIRDDALEFEFNNCKGNMKFAIRKFYNDEVVVEDVEPEVVRREAAVRRGSVVSPKLAMRGGRA